MKLRMVNQIKPKHHKWTSEITGTIDRDKYDRTIIDTTETWSTFMAKLVMWRRYLKG